MDSRKFSPQRKNKARLEVLLLVLSATFLAIAQVFCSVQAKPADDHLQRGRDLLSQGKFPQATQELSRAIECNPKLAEAYQLRGWLQFWMGHPERGIADLNLAIQLDPKRYESYTSRGEILRQLNKYDDSRLDLDKAIKLKPLLPDAYYLRGLTNLLQGLHIRAKKDFSEAVRLGAKNRYVVFAYYWRGRTEEMQEDYKAAVADFTESINRTGLLPTGNSFRQIDTKAIYMYSAGETKTTALGLLERGLCYSQLGEHAKAVADLTEVLKAQPKETLLLEKRGNAYLALGKYHEALKDFNRALLMGTQSADVYFHLALAHFCMRKFDNAASDLEVWFDRTFWEDDKKNPMAATLMYLCLKRGKHDAKAKRFAESTTRGMAKVLGWRKSIAEMLKGKISAQELVALTDKRTQQEKTQAHCYAGLYLMAESKPQAASQHFNWVFTQGSSNLLEYTISMRESSFHSPK